MNPIRFFVAGKVVGQPRPRATAFGGHARMYTPTKTAGGNPHPIQCWHSLVSDEAMKHKPETRIEGPVCVDIVFMFKRPQAHYRTGKHSGLLKDSAPIWHTSKPDRDNCDKAVLDVLTQLDYWNDDSQVCDGRVIQRYVQGAETPGMTISISAIEEKTCGVQG